MEPVQFNKIELCKLIEPIGVDHPIISLRNARVNVSECSNKKKENHQNGLISVWKKLILVWTDSCN